MEEKVLEAEREEQTLDDSYKGELGGRSSRRPERLRRSFFWPVVLIGIGVIWLLANLGIVAVESGWEIWYMWPLILIFIGLNVIFGRRFPALSVVIGLIGIGVFIVLMMFAPSLGLNRIPSRFVWVPSSRSWVEEEVQIEHFEEAVDNAETMDVTVEMDVWETTIEALPEGSDNLVEADIAYVTAPVFDVSGGDNRSVFVGVEGGHMRNLRFDLDHHEWMVGLNPGIPIDLTVEGDVGSAMFDLAALQLVGLEINGGVGEIDVMLPEATEYYEFGLNVDVGSTTVTIPDDANLDMMFEGGVGSLDIEVGENVTVDMEAEIDVGGLRLDVGDNSTVNLTIPSGGVGSITINTPSDAGVRLEVEEAGIGGVTVPHDFIQVEQGDPDEILGDEGVWESPNYDDANYFITITVEEMDIGSVTVRQ